MKKTITISGNKQEIKETIKTMLEFMDEAGIEEQQAEFKVELCLRELLANALEHGCSGVTEPEVTINFSLVECNQIILSVEDPGPGFCWKKRDFSEMPVTEERGRGLPLICSVVDQINFNEQGNRVTVYIKLAAEN